MMACQERAQPPLRKLGSDPNFAGFTLLELLVALAILALFSILGYRAVASLTSAEEKLTTETEQWRTLDMLFNRLEADVRRALPRTVRTGGSIEPPWVSVTNADGNTEFRFSRAGPEFALEPDSAGQRIAYRLRDGAVEVVYWPMLDTAPGIQPTAYPLAEGIQRFHVSCLDASGVWREQWLVAGDSPLPRAIRVELTLANGDGIERLLVMQ